ncbi:hypothetical protein ALC56_14776 [Trachymyrmex septentrionalis]|uniref:Uncharacterized protein n=1 Tax=Trachymyrmex septentrionalis TaxID=34720 RepID=A0A195ESV5_9HYME|nr:hypothetical protein ALC56_14776 [Trachymyrmex septentrionalis]
MNARTVADGWDDTCAASKRDALTTMDLRDAEMPRLITAAFATMPLNLGYDDK